MLYLDTWKIYFFYNSLFLKIKDEGQVFLVFYFFVKHKLIVTFYHIIQQKYFMKSDFEGQGQWWN